MNKQQLYEVLQRIAGALEKLAYGDATPPFISSPASEVFNRQSDQEYDEWFNYICEHSELVPYEDVYIEDFEDNDQEDEYDQYEECDACYDDDPYHHNWSNKELAMEYWDCDLRNPAHDPRDNPWIDFFGPGEEAEVAYLNTH